MSKSNKIIIVIIVALIVYLVVFFILFGGTKSITQMGKEATIIIDESAIWKYSKNTWTNLTQEESINELNWKKYTTYDDDKKLGSYYLWYDDEKWYLFDKDRNSKEYYGKLLAYNSNYNMKLTNFNQHEIDDYKYVEEALATKKIEIDTDDYVVNDQIDIDMDNDGVEENFYIASNSNIYGAKEKTFSLVIMVKNNKIYNLYYEVKDSEEMTCMPYIRAFIDVDRDNKLETIVGCDSLSSDSKKFLYKFNDKNKYEILISNR